jgi:HAD superfamily hydrolase (TIGR01509 family)
VAVKAVVFDLDGTIVTFNIDYRAVRAEVRSLLINCGLPASLASTNESIFEMLKKAEIFLKNNGKNARTFRTVRNNALTIAERFELEAAKSTSLLPGVVETLKALRKMGLKIGLCTINSEKSADYILKRFRIAVYFDALTPRNKVKYVKPNTEHLEASLRALGADPKETVVVGDGGIDMRCANELGAIAVGLPTGLSDPKDLINAGANYIVTSLADLPTLVESINKE